MGILMQSILGVQKAGGGAVSGCLAAGLGRLHSRPGDTAHSDAQGASAKGKLG